MARQVLELQALPGVHVEQTAQQLLGRLAHTPPARLLEVQAAGGVAYPLNDLLLGHNTRIRRQLGRQLELGTRPFGFRATTLAQRWVIAIKKNSITNYFYTEAILSFCLFFRSIFSVNSYKKLF